MNRLDEELERALGDPATQSSSQPGASAELPASVVPKAGPRPRRRKRSWGLLLWLVAMGIAILAMALTGIDEAAVYSKGVDQLLQEPERFVSRNVRVVGTLVKGSLMRRSEPCEYRFRLGKGTARLNVQYPQCIIPDALRDVPGVDVEVTVEGRLQKDGSFLAHQIMAKCPSKYEMKQRNPTQQGMQYATDLAAVETDNPPSNAASAARSANPLAPTTDP